MNLQGAAHAAQKASLLPQAAYSPTKKMEASKQTRSTRLPTTVSTCLPASVPVDSAFPSVTMSKPSMPQLKPFLPPMSQSHRPQALSPLGEVAPAIFSFLFYVIHFPLFTGSFPSTHILLHLPEPVSWHCFPLQLEPHDWNTLFPELLERVIVTGSRYNSIPVLSLTHFISALPLPLFSVSSAFYIVFQWSVSGHHLILPTAAFDPSRNSLLFETLPSLRVPITRTE